MLEIVICYRQTSRTYVHLFNRLNFYDIRWHLDIQQEMVLLRDEAKGMISKIDFKWQKKNVIYLQKTSFFIQMKSFFPSFWTKNEFCGDFFFGISSLMNHKKKPNCLFFLTECRFMLKKLGKKGCARIYSVYHFLWRLYVVAIFLLQKISFFETGDILPTICFWNHYFSVFLYTLNCYSNSD